jgi:hypothetical protein
LKAFRDMLAGVRGEVAQCVAAGKSAKETAEAKPTAKFDETWGRGFLKPEPFVGIVYASLKGK